MRRELNRTGVESLDSAFDDFVSGTAADDDLLAALAGAWLELPALAL